MNTVKLYLISRVQIRIENYRKPLNFVVYLPCCELRLLLALCSSTNLTEEASSVSFSLWMTRKAHAFGVPFTKKENTKVTISKNFTINFMVMYYS